MFGNAISALKAIHFKRQCIKAFFSFIIYCNKDDSHQVSETYSLKIIFTDEPSNLGAGNNSLRFII